jgi:membrane-bound lytic murein transglycosylase D
MKNSCFALSVTIAFLLLFSFCACSSQPKPSNQPSRNSAPPAQEEEIQEEEKLPSPEQEIVSEDIKQLSQEEPPDEKTENPSELLEDALAAYQDAQTAWEKADIDTALNALDEAYSIILKLDLPQDSPLFQEKNDLRLLIAQRIQEIYASHIIAIGENHNAIPLEENKHILAEVKSFQTTERKAFESAYRLSGRYRDMIREEIRKEGLPEELSWVPVIESGFKTNAYSRARALGLWQFISSTGYRFGLKRDRWIDERMDPEKSTKAALKYLNELHSFFGDWTTVLAAYNCGEFRVQRLIRAQRINYFDNFWDLYVLLPRETARFVPRFIATLLIVNAPAKYGFDLPEPDPPLNHETIQINRPVMLSVLSQKLGLDSDTLAVLNPELRHKSTPDRAYDLKVPTGYGEKALAAFETVPRWVPPEATYVIHYVRRGETVSGIASRYRTSVSAIARLNRLSRNYLIRPGQRLKVPARGGVTYASSSPRTLTKQGEKLVYSVKRGDSLYLIASAFNTTVRNIKELNNLRSNIIHVGQKLIIQSGSPEGTSLYMVRRGDTPYSIARKYGMSLNELLNLNGLSSRSKIYPGQKLWIISRK